MDKDTFIRKLAEELSSKGYVEDYVEGDYDFRSSVEHALVDSAASTHIPQSAASSSITIGEAKVHFMQKVEGMDPKITLVIIETPLGTCRQAFDGEGMARIKALLSFLITD